MEGTLEEIRSLWEVPSIAHFCSLFREAFKLSDFDIEDLEDALLIDGTDYGTVLIQQLVINLLKGCIQKNGINVNNYDQYLMDFMARKHAVEGKQFEFSTNTVFKDMPVRTKVEFLHSLCNYRLDGSDVTDLLKNLESDSLRVEPLGKDESGATYWYFYGTRLYKEVSRNKVDELRKKQKGKKKQFAEDLKGTRTTHRNRRKIKKVKKFTYSSESECDGEAENMGPITGWSIVCSTEEDWQGLAKKFKNSKHRSEKELYKSISEDFLPEIGRIAQEKEKNLKRKLIEMAPRRASQRIEGKKQEQDVSGGEQSSNTRKRSRSDLNISHEDTESLYSKKSRQERELDRIKAKDARAKRAQQRNEKLIQNDGNLSSFGDNRYFVTTEELYVGMYKVIEAMKDHPNSWPFLRPVKDELVPGYNKIIKNPMDISIIEGKLESQMYFTRHDFEADIMLMLDNCREFNGRNSRYTRMAESLRKVYKDTTEDVFVLENGDDDTYKPSPSKRPARPKAAAALKRTLSAVHKNSAVLGQHGRASTGRSPESINRKSWLTCRTIPNLERHTPSPKNPLQSSSSSEPRSSLSKAVVSNGGSVLDANAAVQYSVLSINDFAHSNPTLEASNVGTSLLINKMPLPSSGFHRLPVNIGTSVRSKLALAKPVQLNLGTAGLNQVASGTLPNGARALILKPGQYVLNQNMTSIVKTDSSSPLGQGRTMVLVCTPKMPDPNTAAVGNLHDAPTITKTVYSIASDSTAVENSTIPSKRFASIQIRNGSSYSSAQTSKENGSNFSQSIRVPVILRAQSGHVQTMASPVVNNQGNDVPNNDLIS